MYALLIIKNICHTYKMKITKQMNIKDRTYYFYNDIIDLEHFNSDMLKIDRKSYKSIDIYNIGYVTIKKIGDCKDINSVNPFYLRITNADGYIEEENENNYLIFDSTDNNKELLKKCNNSFNGFMNEIKKIDGDCDYAKGYMKIKFNSVDNLPLNKLLKFHNMTVTIRYVVKEDDKFYPQVFLDSALYKLTI